MPASKPLSLWPQQRALRSQRQKTEETLETRDLHLRVSSQLQRIISDQPRSCIVYDILAAAAKVFFPFSHGNPTQTEEVSPALHAILGIPRLAACTVFGH